MKKLGAILIAVFALAFFVSLNAVTATAADFEVPLKTKVLDEEGNALTGATAGDIIRVVFTIEAGVYPTNIDAEILYDDLLLEPVEHYSEINYSNVLVSGMLPTLESNMTGPGVIEVSGAKSGAGIPVAGDFLVIEFEVLTSLPDQGTNVTVTFEEFGISRTGDDVIYKTAGADPATVSAPVGIIGSTVPDDAGSTKPARSTTRPDGAGSTKSGDIGSMKSDRSDSSVSPATGDNSSVALWVLLASASKASELPCMSLI